MGAVVYKTSHYKCLQALITQFSFKTSDSVDINQNSNIVNQRNSGRMCVWLQTNHKPQTGNPVSMLLKLDRN